MASTSKVFWGIIVVIIIVLGVWFANSNSTDNPQSLKIGMITILSGQYATVGENFRNGALLASEEYNTTHQDGKIEFVVEDDGFESKKALSAYQKLTSVDKIDALINTSTPSIAAIYDLVTKIAMPVIQAGEQPVEPTDDNIFQILPGNIEAERALGAYLKEKGYKNPAVVFTNHDTMIRFKNAMVAGFAGPVNEFGINADEKDFRTHVLKIIDSKPDVVVILMFPESGAQVVKQYTSSKDEVVQLAFDTNIQSGIGDYKRILNGGSVLNGAIVATIPTNTTQKFKDAYKARFGVEAGFFSDMGYDAFNLLVSTYSSDGKRWIRGVKDADFTGASGKIEFDEIGVRKPIVKMVTIQNGLIPTED